jgi:molybdate transport system substrate-binding protein
MATRQLLAALAPAWTAQRGADAPPLSVESVGGVDAARRVQAGERFDLVVLASDAMAKLMAQGLLVAGTARPLVDSPMVAAQAETATPVPLGSPAALREALLGAPRIGYSTGPSGQALLALIQAWGLHEALAPKLLQAPPGVPVGQLIASGEVALGFQQLSELIHVPGLRILGPLPGEHAITTTFVSAQGLDPAQPAEVAALQDFFASPATLALKLAQGMSAPAAG